MENLDLNIILLFVMQLAAVLIGAGTVAAFFRRANASTELKDSTERLLADLVPIETVKQINDINKRLTDLLQNVISPAAEFIDAVTDGKPNDPPAVG